MNSKPICLQVAVGCTIDGRRNLVILLLYLSAFSSIDKCMFLLWLGRSESKTKPAFACILSTASIHGVTLAMFEALRWVIGIRLRGDFAASASWKGAI